MSVGIANAEALNYRLKLKSIIKVGTIGGDSQNPYFFSYYGEDEFGSKMPYKNCCSGYDKFGYCNNSNLALQDATNPLKLFPNIENDFLYKTEDNLDFDSWILQIIPCLDFGDTLHDPLCDQPLKYAIYNWSDVNSYFSFNEGSDMNPYLDCAKLYSLKDIQYPTGGSTIFSYELNEYSKAASSGEDPGEELRYGGGLRVAKIESISNSSSPPIVTEYLYRNGIVTNQQKWAVHQGFGECLYTIPPGYQIASIHLFSDPILQSNVVGYNEVTETSSLGTTVYTYQSPQYFPTTYESRYFGAYASLPGICVPTFEPLTFIKPIYPYMKGWLEYPFYSGKLLSKACYNSKDSLDQDHLASFELNTYDTTTGNYIYSMEAGDEFGTGTNYRVSISRTPTGKSFLRENTITNYYHPAPGFVKEISSKTKYFYNEEDELLEKVTTFQSNGDSLITLNYYPKNISDLNYAHTSQEILDTLIFRHMLNTLLIKENRKNNVLVDGVITSYGLYNNGDLIAPKLNFKLAGNTYEKTFTMDQYDLYGNLIQFHKEHDKNITFLWGYNYLYPVAKIVNADFNTVSSYIGCSYEALQSKSNPELDLIFHSLRENLGMNQTLVYSYTYKPLYGIVSKTEPNGISVCYEYDKFGRLLYLKDYNNNILQQYKYNFQKGLDYLEVLPDNVTFSQCADNVFITVLSIVEWDAEVTLGGDFLSIEILTEDTFRIDCTENLTGNYRFGKIRIFGEGVDPIIVNVKQRFLPE